MSLYNNLAVVSDSQDYLRYYSDSVGERLWDAVCTSLPMGDLRGVTEDGFILICNNKNTRAAWLEVARRLVPDAPMNDGNISFLPNGVTTMGGIAEIEKEGEVAACVVFVKREDGATLHRYVVLSNERFWPLAMMRFL